MNFKFGNTPATSTQGESNQIAANQIVTVKFDGVTKETIEKKDGSASFQVVKIKFSADGKTFEHTVFEPRPEDHVRKENNFGYENPSAVEEMMFAFRHLLAAVAPKVNEAIEKKGGIDVPSWDKLRDFMVENTTKAIGTETQIKLLADSNGRARFPGFVLGISKKGDAYPRTNFIGAKLAFTAKELERINTANNAKPTAMSDITPDLGNSATSIDIEDDFILDLESI